MNNSQTNKIIDKVKRYHTIIGFNGSITKTDHLKYFIVYDLNKKITYVEVNETEYNETKI